MHSRLDNRRATTALAAAMASGLVLVGAVGTAESPASARQAIAQDDFVITGEISGLFPGLETTVNTQVTNPQGFTITVTSVEVTVDDASAGCAGSWLHFGPLADTVDVASGATATVPLPVELDFDAPEACREATWPLTFVATAIGAGDPGSPPTAMTGDQTPSGPQALARTGLDVVAPVALAGLLIVAGAVLRRRARRTTP